MDIHLDGLIVRPGDTLLLACKEISRAEAAEIVEELGSFVEGVQVVFLRGVEQIAAYRPEPEAEERHGATGSGDGEVSDG